MFKDIDFDIYSNKVEILKIFNFPLEPSQESCFYIFWSEHLIRLFWDFEYFEIDKQSQDDREDSSTRLILSCSGICEK